MFPLSSTTRPSAKIVPILLPALSKTSLPTITRSVGLPFSSKTTAPLEVSINFPNGLPSKSTAVPSGFKHPITLPVLSTTLPSIRARPTTLPASLTTIPRPLTPPITTF